MACRWSMFLGTRASRLRQSIEGEVLKVSFGTVVRLTPERVPGQDCC